MTPDPSSSPRQPPGAGTLRIVSTPIGNLEDITLRALRTLRESAVVAAEDTRRTAQLLNHYQIATRQLSLHAHNEHQRVPALLERLGRGEDVALVSDAGTPLLSDPGAALVRAAREAGFRVEAIPGPSAVLAALVTSGLAGEGFTFAGFPPVRSKARIEWFAALASEPRPVIFFEAPHRLDASLADALTAFGDRPAAIARELTKAHEETVTGRLSEIAERLHDRRGEFTIVIGPAEDTRTLRARPSDAELWRDFCKLQEDDHLGRREALSRLARTYGLTTRDVYSAIERAKAANPEELCQKT